MKLVKKQSFQGLKDESFDGWLKSGCLDIARVASNQKNIVEILDLD